MTHLTAEQSRFQAMVASNRSYYSCVLGAAGGLSGWYVAAVFSTLAPANPPLGFQAVIGGMLTALVAFGVCAYHGIAARSFARMLRYAIRGAACGFVGGAIVFGAVAFPAASQSATDGLWRGFVGWMGAGALAAAGDSAGKGSIWWKNAMAGIIGGGLGGAVWQLARSSASLQSPAGDQTILACASTLAGAWIGYFIAVADASYRAAWLEVETGAMVGCEINLSRYALGDRAAAIGSAWDATIYLPPETGVPPRHASLAWEQGNPVLRLAGDRHGPVSAVNGRYLSSAWQLCDGDRIQFGPVMMTFHEKSTEQR